MLTLQVTNTGLEGLSTRLQLNHFSFFLPYPVPVGSYRTSLFPVAYNNSPTIVPGCLLDGDSLSCGGGTLLIDNDIGSADLNTSKVFAWDN